MHKSLELASAFNLDVLKELPQHQATALRGSEQAEFFLAMHLPELEKKIRLAEKNIEDAHAADEENPELEARVLHTKGCLYFLAARAATCEMLPNSKQIAELAYMSGVALHQALQCIDMAQMHENERIKFKDACLWQMAGAASVAEDRARELEMLRHVERLGGEHSLKAAQTIQEIENEPEQPQSNSGCFIATVAFGGSERPEVLTLRNFRDEVLAHSRLGRTAVRTYYRFSPGIACWLETRPRLRSLARIALAPVATLAHWWSGLRW